MTTFDMKNQNSAGTAFISSDDLSGSDLYVAIRGTPPEIPEHLSLRRDSVLAVCDCSSCIRPLPPIHLAFHDNVNH
jgi:hypothetical protein